MKKKVKKIKYHVFCDKEYEFEWIKTKGILGEVDDPSYENRIITINENQSEKNLLNTLIHESLHILNWKASETKVKITADCIADLLWKCGYRTNNSKLSTSLSKNKKTKKKKKSQK